MLEQPDDVVRFGAIFARVVVVGLVILLNYIGSIEINGPVFVFLEGERYEKSCEIFQTIFINF